MKLKLNFALILVFSCLLFFNLFGCSTKKESTTNNTSNKSSYLTEFDRLNEVNNELKKQIHDLDEQINKLNEKYERLVDKSENTEEDVYYK